MKSGCKPDPEVRRWLYENFEAPRDLRKASTKLAEAIAGQVDMAAVTITVMDVRMTLEELAVWKDTAKNLLKMEGL